MKRTDAPPRFLPDCCCSRRRFLARSAAWLVAGTSAATRASPSSDPVPLFDGRTLAGWRTAPRLAVPPRPEFLSLDAAALGPAVRAWHAARPDGAARTAHHGRWTVEDGAIVGRPDPVDSTLGGYLISERTYADFELTYEARPDWPVDTGLMLRAHELGGVGYQVLLDHRPGGGIGGIYGNSIGSFLAAPFTVDGDRSPGFRVARLREGRADPRFRGPRLESSATFADFASVWRPNEWNHFRVRCVGELPVITTWINGLLICSLDISRLDVPGFDPELLRRRLGRAGHLALEVHDVHPRVAPGWDRWAPGAVCRWRDLRLREL